MPGDPGSADRSGHTPGRWPEPPHCPHAGQQETGQRAGVTVTAADPSPRSGHHQPSCSGSTSRCTWPPAAAGVLQSPSTCQARQWPRCGPLWGHGPRGSTAGVEQGCGHPAFPSSLCHPRNPSLATLGSLCMPRFSLPGLYSDAVTSPWEIALKSNKQIGLIIFIYAFFRCV